MQRGFQVYKEVCSACHSLRLVAFRDLKAIGYNDDEVKAIAAKGAWVMLTLFQGVFGYDVDREGNVLQIMYKGSMIPLNVAEQCSGMRMVVAFLALSALMSLGCKHWWQRIALVLLATPVAVFLNIIRVGVLGLASLFSPGLASGSAHMLIGTLLLAPGLGLFMACSWALQKMVQDAPAEKKA